MIRKATPDDIDQIEKIYAAIHDAEENGTLTIGWLRGVYPVRKTAVDRNRPRRYVRGGRRRRDCGRRRDQPDPAAEYANCRWVNDVPDSENYGSPHAGCRSADPVRGPRNGVCEIL